MTLWALMKEFINSKEDGRYITRQELIEYILPERRKASAKQTYSTIDVYRSHLTNIKVLETVRPGYYIKLRDIPEALSSSLLKKISLDKTWKQWFLPLDDKIKNPGLWRGE